MIDKYDVIIIGAGPGGYVAAIRSAQLGMKVALVEKGDNLGGTCLNIGCIPSKALLHSSHLYYESQHNFLDHGIEGIGTEFNVNAMMKRKEKVVSDTAKGVDYLIKKNNIDRIYGIGTIIEPRKVSVKQIQNGTKTIHSEKIVIATGSEALSLPGIKIDEKKIVSSTGALRLSKIPESLVVVGAGAIGLELGSIWRRLGSRVTVVESMEGPLPGMDNEIAKLLTRVLGKQGFEFKFERTVKEITKTKTGISITIENSEDGIFEELPADVMLLAIGRRPYTRNLGLEKLGIKTDEHGFVKTNERFSTNVDGVFAIGDVIGGPMLAHKAEDEGVVLAELLAGQAGEKNYETVPTIVYTWPEVAGLGKTEQELKRKGIVFKVGKYPFSANARARIIGDIDGFVKIIADANTDLVLGVHIVGAAAGELIQECVSVMEFGGVAEDIARICHGHPGLCEVVKEAALAVDRRAIHM